MATQEPLPELSDQNASGLPCVTVPFPADAGIEHPAQVPASRETPVIPGSFAHRTRPPETLTRYVPCPTAQPPRSRDDLLRPEQAR